MHKLIICFAVIAFAVALPACVDSSDGSDPTGEGAPVANSDDSDPPGEDAPVVNSDDNDPPVEDAPVTPGSPPTCPEEQEAYVRGLLPRGEDISVAEAVLAVMAHAELTRDLPYCSGKRP